MDPDFIHAPVKPTLVGLAEFKESSFGMNLVGPIFCDVECQSVYAFRFTAPVVTGGMAPLPTHVLCVVNLHKVCCCCDAAFQSAPCGALRFLLWVAPRGYNVPQAEKSCRVS